MMMVSLQVFVIVSVVAVLFGFVMGVAHERLSVRAREERQARFR